MTAARILIVEDESIVAEDIRDRLTHLGYNVIDTASSGEEALRLVEQSKPDLVIMDIRLQGDIDGIEAAERVRLGSRVPVVFLTAHADDATLERAKVTEPFGYIVKPFVGRELHTAIEVALYKFQMDGERARMLQNLRQALGQVKTLSGLLPICACCKKVRDGEGYWEEVNEYLARNADANISLGICPECEKAHADSGPGES